MSIRTVKCPRCGTGANVPAGMANVKCGSCGSIWNVNNPSSSGAASPTAATGSRPKNSSGGSVSKQQTTLIAGIAGVLAVLATIGIAIAFFVKGSSKPLAEPSVAAPPAAAPIPTAVITPMDLTPAFREVDLPESTRQRIYFDYRKLVESSTEKKIMVLKESPVNKSLQNMLGKTVDREITHFSLIHKITEDDVRQIIAEGDAKQWPGSRPLGKETEIEGAE